jgi:hypothetical protein
VGLTPLSLWLAGIHRIYLQLPDQVKDLDLAAVHLAELQGIELEPYLHYRFLLLETHSRRDFDSLADFERWFDRQAGVFLSGLFWALENIADIEPEFGTVTLGALDTFTVREAYYEVAAQLEALKELLSVEEEVDSEAFVDVTSSLEEDVEKLYGHLDRGHSQILAAAAADSSGRGGAGGGSDQSPSLASTFSSDTWQQEAPNAATNHCLPLAYPLNMELYTTTALALFDQELWGELVPYADELLEVLAHWRGYLGVSDKMHQLAMVRCHFIVYTQAIARAQQEARERGGGDDDDDDDDDGGAQQALNSFEAAVTQLQQITRENRAAGVTPSEDEIRLEVAITTDTLKSMESRLMDYHWCFPAASKVASVIRGEFDVFASIKFAQLLESESAASVDKRRATEAQRFIRSSVHCFYERLSKEVDRITAATAPSPTSSSYGEDASAPAAVASAYLSSPAASSPGSSPLRPGGGTAAVDDTPLSGISDLGVFLAEDGILKVMQTAKQFKVYYAKAAEAAATELTKGLKDDLVKRLVPYNEVSVDVAGLLGVVHDVLATVAELFGSSSKVLSRCSDSLLEPFQRLVRRELEMQHFKFTAAVEACIGACALAVALAAAQPVCVHSVRTR